MADENPEISPMAEPEPEKEPISISSSESPPREDGSASANGTEAPDEEAAAEAPVESSEAPVADLKRKLEDLEAPAREDESAPAAGETPAAVPDDTEARTLRSDEAVAGDAKRQRLEGEADGLAADGGEEMQKVVASAVGNGVLPSGETLQHASTEVPQKSTEAEFQQGMPSTGVQAPSSRKIEVPNNKVGVLIGKAGETIRNLQNNSGAKIQITRDADSDPNSSSRPVELIGSLENINKAEQLIKDVIAEADAGGSPALVAKGFGAAQSGSELLEMQVPNEKVGLIIGKGGETIKNLQTKSGARIQLIPQHLPEGDLSKERMVRVTGNKKQIEDAKELIKEVMNQGPRPSPLSAGYTQSYRARGPAAQPQWGPRAPPAAQMQPQPTMGYDYQRGMYPPQSTQYPPSYGGYSQQAPPRSSIGAGWEQRPAAPAGQTPPQTGGYDYYGQGQAFSTQPSQPAPAHSAAPSSYNYGQSQVTGYGQPTQYPQSGPTQQNYGQGYGEPKYENQAPYGQQPVSSQPGFYPQQGSTPQTGYTQQQPYSKPATYGVPPSYGPPRATQPGDPMYQGSLPSTYGSTGPTQQSYPYGSTAPPTQAAPTYGQTYGQTMGVADGYTQPPSSAGYSHHTGQVTPGYGQGVQPAPAYTQQAAPTAGYGQYPSAQPSYGDQPAPNSANYGYQGGSVDASYGNSLPSSGYGAAPVGSQAGYGQGGYVQPPPSNPASYDQSVPPQSGYAHPGAAPVGYSKGVSPQPGYGGQYDSVQMYGHH